MIICWRKVATPIHVLSIFRMTFEISRISVFDVWFTNAKECRMDALLHHILQEFGNPSLPDEIINKLKAKIRSCAQQIEVKWTKSGRHRDRFLKTNCAWLEESFSFNNIITENVTNISLDGPSSRPGRPQKEFDSSSHKTKMRRIQHLLDSTSEGELSLATEVQLRKKGKRDSAAIVKELCEFSPRRGTTMKRARVCFSNKKKEFSADQAVALIVDANLSTHQYDVIRQQAKLINTNIYPAYCKVKLAKKLCYPNDIDVTETYAEIKLQSLIDHTVTRLCKAQEEVLKTIKNIRNLLIVVKWGCDGAEQNRYKQKFSEEQCSDESLFSISMVPLQIYVENKKNIIWQNPSPSSTRYCRPIKIMFAKENANLITTEVDKIRSQIETLTPTKISVNSVEMLVKVKMIFCMIDGKVCNAVASCASTQTCYLCGAKPKEMNNKDLIIAKTVKQDFLLFGLSPLHAWIRFFECIIHISYRLGIKSWQARGDKNKKIVAEKKKYVQEKFRSELGLLVDMPKQNTGNTNDGNTARKFFRNAEKSADITGVSVALIKRFHVILECINSGFPVNCDKFDEYSKATSDLYIKEYSWYPMPVSVHKILFHGKDIISSCVVPIGQLSEEAQESRNKHNKKFRELFTRKTSRVDTNRDLINRLLMTSDPYIASLRGLPKTKRGQITPEVQELLEIRTPSMGIGEGQSDEFDQDSSRDTDESDSD